MTARSGSLRGQVFSAPVPPPYNLVTYAQYMDFFMSKLRIGPIEYEIKQKTISAMARSN